jgi:ketosteroid isomerase-like protein
MTESSNMATVRRFYSNLRSPEVLMEVLSPTIQWDITAGFPYGGVYSGVESVFNDFVGRVLGDFEDWKTEMSELIDAGDRVIGLGAYSGRSKSTGKGFSARFAHVWTLADNRMVRLQQCADSAQLRAAAES